MKRRVLLAALLGGMLHAGLAVPQALAHGDHPSILSPLKQSLLVVTDRKDLRLPALVTAQGKPYAPERLKGHWTVVYFGFTSCPDVCPTTLHALSVVAATPASEVATGRTVINFVSVDPTRDTPARLTVYLKAYDRHIQGLTGTPSAVRRFADVIGAAYQPVGQQFDHSTSAFVLDPSARLAGILLRPSDPARVLADLATLRQATGVSRPGTPHP